jgi:hypothetical protein
VAPTTHAHDPAKPQATAEDSPGFDYKLPDGWTKGPPRQMRVATFAAGPQAEVIVTKFPAGTGSRMDNINRWRGMVELPPIKESDPQPSKTISVGGNEATLFDFVGPARRTMVVWAPIGQEWWFFRIVGPIDAVGQHNDSFMTFLSSVQFTSEKRESTAQ